MKNNKWSQKGLIENNNGRLGKKLWTDGADGEPISLYCAFNELDEAAPVHQSCFKNHMCVLGWISRSHARDGIAIQTSGRGGYARKIEKVGFLIPVIPKHAWKSWNLAWCHDMAPSCRGNIFGRIGTSFGVSFLQTGASLKKARGSEREGVTSLCETTYVHCLLLP